MNKLNLYVTRYLITFLLMAIGITTFVMMAGNFARVFDMLAKGVSVQPLLLFVLYKTPQLLSYTIPMGILVSTVMLFNRMSAEHEISALRASGVSLLQVTAPPLLLSILLSVLCLYLQAEVVPRLNHEARALLRVTGAQSPLTLLEEGTFNTLFDGFIVKIDRIEGEDIAGVHIYEVDPVSKQLIRNITAPRGHIVANDQEKRLDLILYNTTIISVDEQAPDDPHKLRRMFAEQFTIPFDYGRAINERELVRRISDMNLAQLFAHARISSESGMATTKHDFELHKRAALALAPFSLLLIGIPLGLQVNRRENSAGLIVAIVIAFFYFGAGMLVEMIYDQSHLHPLVLTWLPNLACQGAGIYLLWKRR